jgi:hypothetical protein
MVLELCPPFAIDGRQTRAGTELFAWWWWVDARTAPFSHRSPSICSSCGRRGPTVGSHDLCRPCARLDALLDSGRVS